MKLDTRLTSSALTLALAAVVIPFTADWQLPLLNGVVVRWIENGQALWLLFGALFTAWYIRPLSRPEGAKQFWLWAVVWWGVLLGRSTSLGRDYFPDEPRMLFRTISVLLIAALVLPVLFSAGLRKEIVRRLRDAPLPLWLFTVTACSYLISDTVEHHRWLSPIFLHNARYTDLIEELYEVPFMIGLFMVTVVFMQQDKQDECTALEMTPYHAK
ncbi:hypothetical protein N0Q68_002550 [Salmonella enterica]|uniref:Nitric oxide reductase n=2 Tax=Salmonella enterica I TaxID=59201 RepID=A0A3Z3UBV9_SALET|nr:hypothetical protein [Salmonella enterica subsp. enterica]EAA8910240.1 hypothetical protein [Salmonella enterica subsp. enterica serovar Paratyphi B]EAN0735552.1 hypothetical protein [Salmonella enterica]EBH8381286.1 hypothetical protein [Salmonella enterica subsp. enterica serovar 4,5,12:b:-]ECS8963037.1 hypothetical protein [Salmonella enterica subsp. enterica serovar Java]ECT9493506.1 hypothetical protein [Salmonella enterica subsp. enterica serovar 4,[5],12:b:-]EDG9866728.1 hypothetica